MKIKKRILHVASLFVLGTTVTIPALAGRQGIGVVMVKDNQMTPPARNSGEGLWDYIARAMTDDTFKSVPNHDERLKLVIRHRRDNEV